MPCAHSLASATKWTTTSQSCVTTIDEIVASPRVRPHRRLRSGGADYVRDSGAKRVRGCTARQLRPSPSLAAGAAAARADHPDAGASKVLGRPRRCKLAHAFLWAYSDKRRKLAQLPGQLGVLLTGARAPPSCAAARRRRGSRRGRRPPARGSTRAPLRRDKSNFRFRKTASEYDREPGIKWLSCTAK